MATGGGNTDLGRGPAASTHLGALGPAGTRLRAGVARGFELGLIVWVNARGSELGGHSAGWVAMGHKTKWRMDVTRLRAGGPRRSDVFGPEVQSP